MDREISTTSEIAIFGPADLADMAAKCAASGLFGMNAAQTFTLMLLAQAEGLHPAQALKRYHVIEGKPSMRADAMQAEFQRRGGQVRWLETSADRVAVEGWHPHLHPEHLMFHLSVAELIESRVACRWDREKREWLVKEMYRRYPRQMLRARAISELVRAIDPGTVAGIYTPEEVRDLYTVEDRGPMPAAPGPPAPPEPPAPPAPREPIRPPTTARPWDRIVPEQDEYGDAEDRGRDWKDFIRREIRAANDDLQNACKLEGKPVINDPVCNGFQVVNHLCTAWIDDHLMEEADIAGPTGKRDRNLANKAVAAAFAESPEDAREDVRDYVRRKLGEALDAAGLVAPGDRDEAQAMADEGPADAPT